MDILVDEIFQKYSNNQEELTFEEWSQWFINLEGMKEVLDMKPHGGVKGANNSRLHQSSSVGRNNGPSHSQTRKGGAERGSH